MRNLLRKPLPWMVVSECAIVAALAMVAWHMVASPPAAPASDALVAVPTAQAREPVNGPTVVREAPPPVQPLLPGLNLDPGFWKLRLGELNGGERSFEQLEWRIVHSVMEAARHYVKSVVLPALAQAEDIGR